MDAILLYLFGAASFIPHGYCLLWRPDLVALHAAGDALTALAYLIIPAAIFYFLRHRQDLDREHFGIAALFAAFIIACAISHIAGLITLWVPLYGLQGLIKVATALISLVTAALIWHLMPELLRLPSPAELRLANDSLRAEIAAKNDALRQLNEARASLEQTVFVRTQELVRLNQRFELALANSSITVFEQDEYLRYLWIYNAPHELAETEIVGREEIDVLPQPAAAEASEIKRRAMQTGRRQEQELLVPLGSGPHWYDLRVEPLASGLGQGVICVAIDITAHKKIEDQLRLVMNELVHRVKNIFAVINSIMSQTARRSASIAEFTADFAERIMALSRGHDQLVREQWQSAGLQDVATAVILPLVGGDSLDRRVKLHGPAVPLDSSQVQNFALAFHELTTNSLKYGALSSDQGVVRITWGVEAVETEQVMTLKWAESDGPVTSQPERRGFGRMMVETLVPKALGGEASLVFTGQGVVWTLKAPLRHQG